jgi:hypothetical protein
MVSNKLTWIKNIQSNLNIISKDLNYDLYYKNIKIEANAFDNFLLYEIQFKEDNLNEIEKLHKIITSNNKLLSQFNSKQLNLINHIFQSKNLKFNLYLKYSIYDNIFFLNKLKIINLKINKLKHLSN